MLVNNSLNTPLMNNYQFRNPMNFMNPNFYYQQFNNNMNMNQMNINFIPYQLYQNNFNNYQKATFYNNNIFYNNCTNKFNLNYSNYIPKPLFSKNNEILKNSEKIKSKNEETSISENENESKFKKNKKYSIDSTVSIKTNTSLEEEKNEENKIENLKINDIEKNNENEIDMDDEDYKINKAKNGGRRFSSYSKNSDCSKCSKSTLNTSISSIKEKEVVEDDRQNLKEKECENKKEIKNETEKYQGNPAFENTVILNVQVKLSKDRTAVFKLKRYDDLFLTIKLFCEINSVDEELIKPLIVKSLMTINSIYQIMNTKLDEEQINILNKINKNI